MTHKSEILSKIDHRTATVGIIGLGYVGIPLAIAINTAKLKVIGFDIDQDRVDGLNAAQSPIKHFSNATIQSLIDDGFIASSDFSKISDCDFLLICVPTPLDEYREPDLGAVISTMDTIQPYFRAGQMLALESTTWPGTTEEILKPYVDKSGLVAGESFFLTYSPEREDPGNAKFETRTIPKVVGGYTEACCAVGTALYSQFIDRVVPVSSTRAAEMVKLVENIHRSVNIGLINELKKVSHAMGLDIFEIIDAAATKPFGFTPYYPGPGIGGHCIPIDPFYLTWKAREFGLHTRFIELAGEINAEMPEFVLDNLIRALNKNGKALSSSKILCLGIAYKRDVDDMRESPSVIIMELLREWGAEIAYSDMHVPTFPKMREHSFDLSSVELSPEHLASYDAVLILTDHSEFDYKMIKENAQLIIDSRGIYRAGSKYENIGPDNVVEA